MSIFEKIGAFFSGDGIIVGSGEWQPVRIAPEYFAETLHAGRMAPWHEKTWSKQQGMIVKVRPAVPCQEVVDGFRRMGCVSNNFYQVESKDAARLNYHCSLFMCEHQILAD